MTAKTELALTLCFTCHKRPDRSFHYRGKPFPICARCTGLGIGYMLSFVLLFIFGLFPWWWIPFLILPMAIDGTGQLFQKWTSNNSRRFLTGMLAGVGLFFVIFTYIHAIFIIGRTFGEKWF